MFDSPSWKRNWKTKRVTQMRDYIAILENWFQFGKENLEVEIHDLIQAVLAELRIFNTHSKAEYTIC